MYRTILYKQSIKEFSQLKAKVEKYFDNEIIYKMDRFYKYRHQTSKKQTKTELIDKPLILNGDSKFELKKLPQKVEELEAKMAEFDEKVADPSFYQQDGEKVKEFLAEREALQAQIDTLYQRWEELETIKEEGQ